MRTELTEQQGAALSQLSGLSIVASCAGRSRSLIVRLGDRLFYLSPAGLLTRCR